MSGEPIQGPEAICRFCEKRIAWDTRTQPGYLPRTAWYDDFPSDPVVCFRARRFEHEPTLVAMGDEDGAA